jgi:predicted metallo-beta-lactamase superfamily hydrolase
MVNGKSSQRGKIQLSGEFEITPLASESLGVRSLATQVQTADASILIDPNIALGFRDNYHPHPTEYLLLKSLRKQILQVAQSTDLIVISHFHHDHFMPFFRNYALFWSNPDDAEALYSAKKVWCKDIRSKINYSQQGRGYNFVRRARKVAEEVKYVDGKAMKIGKTLIRFSPAVPHGESGTKLGWVTMTSIRCGGFTMVHASDVQGPMVKETANWILHQKPDVLILAGPPTYLSPDRVSREVIEKAATNLSSLSEQVPMIIVDHHLLRDKDWGEWLGPIQQHASKHGNQVMTVAEVLGQPSNQLEAQRESLYEINPPSTTYEVWVKDIKKSRTRIRPPLNL